MKKLLLLLLIAPVIFVSCGQTPKNSSVNSNEIAEKRIFQKIDSDAYGMIKDLEISELKQIDSITFEATHKFTNPMLEKKLRIKRNYTFYSTKLDSIVEKVDLKTEMESQGEWVDF